MISHEFSGSESIWWSNHSAYQIWAELVRKLLNLGFFCPQQGDHRTAKHPISFTCNSHMQTATVIDAIWSRGPMISTKRQCYLTCLSSMQASEWLRYALTNCIDGNVDRWIIWYSYWNIHVVFVFAFTDRLSIAIDNDRGVGSGISWQFCLSMHIHKAACTQLQTFIDWYSYMHIPLQLPSSSSRICTHQSSELNINVVNVDISIEDNVHIHTASASSTLSVESTSKQHKLDHQLQLNANTAHRTPHSAQHTPYTEYHTPNTTHQHQH